MKNSCRIRRITNHHEIRIGRNHAGPIFVGKRPPNNTRDRNISAGQRKIGLGEGRMQKSRSNAIPPSASGTPCGSNSASTKNLGKQRKALSHTIKKHDFRRITPMKIGDDLTRFLLFPRIRAEITQAMCQGLLQPRRGHRVPNIHCEIKVRPPRGLIPMNLHHVIHSEHSTHGARPPIPTAPRGHGPHPKRGSSQSLLIPCRTSASPTPPLR